MNTIVGEILRFLSTDLREEFEERAAIMEFDGGMSRDHAECLALLCILKNHPAVLSLKSREQEDLI